MPYGNTERPRVGDILRLHRIRVGLTQEELAERSGLSVRSISDIECNRRRPYPRSVRLLAAGLQLPEADRQRLLQSYRPSQGPDHFAPDNTWVGLRRTARRVGPLIDWALDEVDCGNMAAANGFALQALRAATTVKDVIEQ